MAYSGHRTNTRPPTTVHRVAPDLFELRSLLDIASQGTLLPDLLEEWVSSSLRDMSLRTWIDARSGAQPQWVRVDTEWEERARARLFHGAPEL